MKKIISITLCLCMILSVSFIHCEKECGAKAKSNIVKISVMGSYNYKVAQYILQYTNKERSKRGLSKLKMDKSLMKAAMKRACEISVYVSEKHIRPNGKDRASLNRKIQWENTIEGQDSPYFTSKSQVERYYKKLAKNLVKDWMDSPHHREGILKGNFKSIGVGVFMSGSWTYASQEFSSHKARKKCKSYKVGKAKYHKVSTQKKHVLKKYFKIVSSVVDYIEGEKGSFYIIHKNPYFSAMQIMVNPKQFKYSSSNKSVATINKKGEFVILKKGVTTFKATYKGNKKVVLKKKIRVEAWDEE